VQSTADAATTAYNYDHVSNEYGPGAGSSYLFMPYLSVSRVINRARGVFTGTPPGKEKSKVPAKTSGNEEKKTDTVMGRANDDPDLSAL
jgi:hypothetical protein